MAAVEALLAAGASLEAASRRNGATPLHLAARAGRAEVVVRLLNAGAALNQRNKRGETALSVASDPLTIRSLLVRLPPPRAHAHAALGARDAAHAPRWRTRSTTLRRRGASPRRRRGSRRVGARARGRRIARALAFRAAAALPRQTHGR